MPPVTREMVSRPERSVMWTKVSLKEAKILATPKTSSPCSYGQFGLGAGIRDRLASRTWGPSWVEVSIYQCAHAFRCSYLDVLLRTALDLLLGRHVGCGLLFDDEVAVGFDSREVRAGEIVWAEDKLFRS